MKTLWSCPAETHDTDEIRIDQPPRIPAKAGYGDVAQNGFVDNFIICLIGLIQIEN